MRAAPLASARADSSQRGPALTCLSSWRAPAAGGEPTAFGGRGAVPNKGAKRGHIILSLLLLTVVAQLFLLCSFLFAMGELHPACQPIHGTLVEYRMRM